MLVGHLLQAAPEQTPTAAPEQGQEQSQEQGQEQTPEQTPEQGQEQTPEQSQEQAQEQAPRAGPQSRPQSTLAFKSLRHIRVQPAAGPDWSTCKNAKIRVKIPVLRNNIIKNTNYYKLLFLIIINYIINIE